MQERRSGLYEPSTEKDSCGMGFVAHIKGEKSRGIVEQALEVLHRMRHRAATGADPLTGDGAGILVQVPDRFFRREGVRLGFTMPPPGAFGIAQVFLPADTYARTECEQLLTRVVEQEGQRIVGWRDVPIDAAVLGPVARGVLPVMRQLIIARRRTVPSAFERKLFIIRKLAENLVRASGVDGDSRFHIASCSAQTIVYKGLLLPSSLPLFYLDLKDPQFESAIAMVHSRFSTNTSPTWDLAQPFRFIAHNGEINTVQGNRNSLQARRTLLQSAKFGGGLERLAPIIVPGKSDSAQFDNMLELLVLGGRSLPNAMMLMIPEAWERNAQMDDARRAFYQYSSSLMEPWDGPAAITFTDGKLVGATLDRNGLRPARYVITDDDRVILASEAGVLDIAPESIKRKGRLQPGRMFLVDTEEGCVVEDDEVKKDITSRWPYRKWLEQNVFTFDDVPPAAAPAPLVDDELTRIQRAFGWSDEDLRLVIGPMADTGKEPTGSMGTDTPIAALSDRAPSLFDYFHQLFAQVTNPPIDPIREALVMSLSVGLGPDGNTFEETPEQCAKLTLPGPVLTNEQVARIKALAGKGDFDPTVLDMTYEPGSRGALERAVDDLCELAVRAVDEGSDILILSDRKVDARRAPMPALLATSAVHQRLVRDGIRRHTGLLVETGEVREVHQVALLIGYGAAAVNPWLCFDSLPSLSASKDVSVSAEKATHNLVHAFDEGLLKVISKMGVSTIQSYRGAQIFECLGLNRELVDRHFTGTPSRLSGIGLDDLDREALERHRRGFDPQLGELLPFTAGNYQWRRRGEIHKWNPSTIAALQHAAAANDPAVYAKYEAFADDESRGLVTLRGLLEFEASRPVPLDEVESAASLVKRFVTGAMSFGSLSPEAHETLAIAMNRIGGKSNSGEGGEEPRRFVPDSNGDWRRSAIKQIASARFGVTTEYLVNADELQIKVAQGAKPGEGGQLPGHKVDERIAKVRWSTPGVTLISPPPHHDIYSIEDLAQLIYDLQCVNRQARVSVKLVSEVGVGTIAAGVAKAGAGGVTISGYEGGTGASPLSSIKRAGLPWELGLAEAQQVLVQNGLRGRIRLQVDGGLRTSRDVAIAALLGAEEFGLASASLVVEGCVMLRKCHLNTCSVGIATQDPALRSRFAGKPESVVNFFMLLTERLRGRMAALGFRRLDDMIGRVDRLRVKPSGHWKASKLDLRPVISLPDAPDFAARRCQTEQRKDVSDSLDIQILKATEPSLASGTAVLLQLPISNAHRAVGAMLAGEIAKRTGAQGLADDTIRLQFTGSAGQSFGAFATKGMTLELEGDANDYVGKGLSGGRLVIRPPKVSRFAAEDNVLIGNTVLYGATSGEAYLSGLAGERFAVRNSGARCVVEGVGDHACEYMTGGVVVVLGNTGRNFGAGMSGGTAYVFDRQRTFRERCNTEMIELESLVDESDIWLVYGLIENHVRYTQSQLARKILDNWEHWVASFIKVMPTDYKRVLQARRASLRPRASPPRLRLLAGKEG
jgi:glutamate synthase (NADPH) large chain